MLRSSRDRATHARLFGEIRCLHEVETLAAPAPAALASPATIAFWNVERLRHVEATARVLAERKVDVALLSEVDIGMARTGQGHTIRELAARRGCGYVFGVELVELGLGDAAERARYAGEENLAGLHGAGLLARCPIRRPALMRLDREGAWFGETFGERRIGGRIAVAGQVGLAGKWITIVSVHLESHSDPRDRTEKTARLIEMIDAYDPAAPVIIGGDFNTSSVGRAKQVDRAAMARMLEADPRRRIDPVPHEPLFGALSASGYAWARANVADGPTERRRPDDADDWPLAKIGWFFTRGLEPVAPQIVPALDEAGRIIADHEMLLVPITV